MFLKKLFWALVALIVPSFVLAQTVDIGDGKTTGGDTRITVSTSGQMVNVTLSNLYAYDDNGNRLAYAGDKPEYFAGATVYALRIDDWRGGPKAASVDLAADNARTVLGSAKVVDGTVTLSYPYRQPTAGNVSCQPMNFLHGGQRVWIGHPGWKKTNTEAGIGPFMVLVGNDSSKPATVVCVDAAGKVLPLTAELRQILASRLMPS